MRGDVARSARAGRRALRALPLAVALTLAAPGAALAQGQRGQPTAQELSTARQLFDKALKAEDAGQWAAALELHQRIAKITVSPVLLYHTGLCHEKLGHLVDSLNAYELAVQEAEQKKQDDVAAEAKSHIADLRRRTPQLVLNVPKDAENVSITLDDKPLNSALAGTAMLVDPGERHVIVRADNYTTAFDQKVSIAEGATKTVEARLGEKRAPAVAAVTPVGPAGSTQAAAKPAAAPGSTARPPASRVPLVLAGVATIGFGAVAIGTGLAAHGKHTEYEDLNASPAPGSLDERTGVRDQGRSLALVSTLCTVGAVVAGGITAYLFFSAPPPAKTGSAGTGKARASVAPWAGPDAAGVVAWGSL